MSGFSICPIVLDNWQGFEYASGITFPRVLNMLRHSSNDIIIIIATDVMILELLSTQFVYPGAP